MSDGQIIRRGARTDPESFDQTTDTFTVLLKPGGNLAKDVGGIFQVLDLLNGRGNLDPAGGTIPLPDFNTNPPTTQNPGTAFEIGDYYLIESAGTIGTAIVVASDELPALLMFNGEGDGTSDGDWTLFFVNAAAGGPGATAYERRILTAGEIASKTVVLVGTPIDVDLVEIDWADGGTFSNGHGCTITVATIDWTGEAIDGFVAAGDAFYIRYTV